MTVTLSDACCVDVYPALLCCPTSGAQDGSRWQRWRHLQASSVRCRHQSLYVHCVQTQCHAASVGVGQYSHPQPQMTCHPRKAVASCASAYLKILAMGYCCCSLLVNERGLRRCSRRGSLRSKASLMTTKLTTQYAVCLLHVVPFANSAPALTPSVVPPTPTQSGCFPATRHAGGHKGRSSTQHAQALDSLPPHDAAASETVSGEGCRLTKMGACSRS